MDDVNVKELLKDEIKTEIELLWEGGLEAGSEKYKVSVEGITKLLDKYNEMEKTELEHLDKKEAREMERETERVRMKEERIDRIVKNCLTGITGIGGLVLAVWGTNKSLKFEETGTITTSAGRAFINKLFSKK